MLCENVADQFSLDLAVRVAPMTESATRVRAERTDRCPESRTRPGVPRWTWPSGRAPIAAQQPAEAFVDDRLRRASAHSLSHVTLAVAVMGSKLRPHAVQVAVTPRCR